MDEDKLKDIHGTWIGNKYNLIIGSLKTLNYARLVLKDEQRIVETKKLEILGNSDGRILLKFNNELSVLVLSLEDTEMTILVGGFKDDLKFRKV